MLSKTNAILLLRVHEENRAVRMCLGTSFSNR